MTGTNLKDYPLGTPAQSDYVPFVSSPSGAWAVKNVLVSTLVPSGSIFIATNNSAYQLTPGMVGVFDATHDTSVTTTTIFGDVSVVGIALDTIPIGSSGRFAFSGVQTVAISGNVTRGHWLVAATVAGYAADSGFTQRPTYGAIGQAMQTYSGGATSTIQCLVSINPYASTNTLQMVGSVQTFTYAGASGGGTITVPSGTDGMLVLVPYSSTTGTGPAAGSWQSVGLTSITVGVVHNSMGFAALSLKNPAAATNTLSLSGGNANNYCTVVVICFQSTQSTINRALGTLNYGTATTDTDSATSAVGDLVFDVAIEAATSGQTWTPGAGVTRLVGTAGDANYKSVFVGWANGAASTTSMQTSWTTSNLYEHQLVAVAGS